jgi:hypothetical protein
MKDGGNVGIGTTSPLGKFDVYRPAGASGTAAIVISNGEANGKNWAISTEVVDGGDFALLQSATTGGTPTPTVANVRFIINNSGNVGIGTITPSQRLSIYGDIAIANSASIQETRIGKYQSGSLGSGTHTIASISVTNVDAVFFDYVIKNSTTDLRAGTVMAVTNASTVEYTDISTADIGDTSRITMISDVSGGNIRLRASIDTGAGSWTIRTLLRTI